MQARTEMISTVRRIVRQSRYVVRTKETVSRGQSGNRKSLVAEVNSRPY